MRKHQQRQILDLLNIIKEAQSAGLYADCQEGVAGIGEFIESIEGEGTRTVELLEEYYELLFKAHNGEIDGKPLSKHLAKIEDSAKSELKPNRIEIAFLSYKASMGDSLESIYLAAKADPECDTYWVPIPYYDINPDGTFGMMHYEGADYYGGGIETTDWQEYVVELRRPDIIFIHYAYDDEVNNASIHPDFYSKHLREFCELLVYVPYFVAAGEVPDYFGYLPGVLNSHLVILQSEKVRQAYIQHYNRCDEEHGLKGKYGNAEEKFIALGSPKFDKVINTRREDCLLPDKWQKLITRPDGSRKKIVLYNTHMFFWIGGGETYFRKIRLVFETFKNSEDVVLWWRPHPNTDLNFRAKAPHMLGEYKAVIEEYKNEAWGIYDDTSDLHRAIAWSDAYYGDWSSLALMYQPCGKPIMIGNFEQFHSKISPIPAIHYIDETDIWFSLRQINSLFKMDKISWKTNFVGSFPDEADYLTRYNMAMYQVSAQSNGTIYFPPFLAKEIAAYSTTDSSFHKLKYEKTGDEEIYNWDFLGAVTYKEYIYFTPCSYPGIARLNTVTNEIDYYSDWAKQLKKLKGGNNDAGFTLSITVDSSLWFADGGANAVVKFDMDTQQSTIYEVGDKNYRYGKPCFDGKDFWLTPKQNTDTPVVKWNPKLGVIDEFSDIYADDKRQHGFLPAVPGGGFLWLLPRTSRHAYKIDINTNSISIAEEFEPDLSGNEISQYIYSRVHVSGDSMYVCNDLAETLIEYNFKTNNRREEVIQYPPETLAHIESLRANVFSQDVTQIKSEYDCYYYECGIIGLAGFLNHLTSAAAENQERKLSARRTEIFREITANADGTAGQSIYNYVKQVVKQAIK